MLKLTGVRALVLVAACSFSLTAPVFADDTKRAISIPEGDLRSALDLLAKQSSVGIVYRPEQVRGLKTHGAHGDLTTEQAVSKILEGTQLKVTVGSTGALLIATP